MNACFGLSLPGKEQSRIKIVGWKANPEQSGTGNSVFFHIKIYKAFHKFREA